MKKHLGTVRFVLACTPLALLASGCLCSRSMSIRPVETGRAFPASTERICHVLQAYNPGMTVYQVEHLFEFSDYIEPERWYAVDYVAIDQSENSFSSSCILHENCSLAFDDSNRWTVLVLPTQFFLDAVDHRIIDHRSEFNAGWLRLMFLCQEWQQDLWKTHRDVNPVIGLLRRPRSFLPEADVPVTMKPVVVNPADDPGGAEAFAQTDFSALKDDMDVLNRWCRYLERPGVLVSWQEFDKFPLPEPFERKVLSFLDCLTKVDAVYGSLRNDEKYGIYVCVECVGEYKGDYVHVLVLPQKIIPSEEPAPNGKRIVLSLDETACWIQSSGSIQLRDFFDWVEYKANISDITP